MTEVELIEKTALRVGMMSFMNHGAASCVYTEGCNGVSQEHLIAFAREVALHCVAALATPTTAPTGKAEEPVCQHDWQRFYKGPDQTHWICSRCEEKSPFAKDASPPGEPVDVEQMLRDCVPGGSSCDPQTIADDIRGWFARNAA